MWYEPATRWRHTIERTERLAEWLALVSAILEILISSLDAMRNCVPVCVWWNICTRIESVFFFNSFTATAAAIDAVVTGRFGLLLFIQFMFSRCVSIAPSYSNLSIDEFVFMVT